MKSVINKGELEFNKIENGIFFQKYGFDVHFNDKDYFNLNKKGYSAEEKIKLNQKNVEIIKITKEDINNLNNILIELNNIIKNIINSNLITEKKLVHQIEKKWKNI